MEGQAPISIRAMTLLWLFLTIASCPIVGQETGEGAGGLKGKLKDQVKVSGSIGYTQTLYSALGGESQRAPFFWQVQANLNIKLGPINMPFSARYNAMGGDATYPTIPSQIGMSPKWKDYTFHIGWRSMTFSEYSLAGNQFVGVGVEYNPKDFWIGYKVVYGRFQRADIFFDQNQVILGVPTYERWGYGAQINLGKPGQKVSLHAFRANDDPTSLNADSLLIKPQMNLVYGLTAEQKITDQISVDGEFTWSALTNDQTLGSNEVVPGYNYLNNIGGVFSANSSTQIKRAMVLNLNLNPKLYSLKFSYRRVDPDYRSLGAVFLNNDLEDITANLGFGVWQNKINVALSGGFQRNNIMEDKVSQTVRTIGAADVTYAPNEHWNFGANFSNFTTNTSQTLVVIDIDTLAYAQVTRAYGGNAMRLIKGEKLNHSIMVMASQQSAITNDQVESQTLIASLSETMTIVGPKVNLTAALTRTQTETTQNTTTMLGPTIGASKAFFEGKLSSNAAFSYLANAVDGVSTGNILNVKAGVQGKVGKHHSAMTNLAYTQRALQETTSEIIVNMGYTYSF